LHHQSLGPILLRGVFQAVATDDETKRPRLGAKGAKKASDTRRRLAAKLRDNLGRRKRQARTRGAGGVARERADPDA
jgi:hypothetical protein